MTDPTERLSCADALSHAWLSEGRTAELPAAVLANRRRSTMRRASNMTTDMVAAAHIAAQAHLQKLDAVAESGGGE